MKKIFTFFIIAIITISCDQSAENKTQEINEDELKKEVWAVIEKRFYAWRDNDLESYMKTQHPDWKRWSTSSNELIDNESYKIYWEEAKGNETVMKMELVLEDIKISPLGDAAIVHFTSNEKFEWIGSETDSGWQTGDIYDDAILRWSEMLVYQDDKWLCVGGHRDLSFPAKRPEKIN